MRILIAEDDFACRKFLYKFLSTYGECDITIDGIEALDAFVMALEEDSPYDLVCLDIMMPRLDGKKVLKAIREIEKQKDVAEHKKAKIIMTTALNDTTNVFSAFDNGCEAYASKPIDLAKFIKVMRKLELIKEK
ncbi:UNVERIFIED_CONTAM: two-component system chemotaxis response regulator CheY [Acetivibrio alkalicellulosi]